MAKQKFKVPKTFGECADMLYTLRDQRYALNKEVKDIEEKEKLIKNHLIENLPKSESASGVAGKIGKISLGSKIVCAVQDWEALQKFILKTKDFSLLQRRVGDAAIKERWENGKKVPGVEPFNVVTVSVTKR